MWDSNPPHRAMAELPCIVGRECGGPYCEAVGEAKLFPFRREDVCLKSPSKQSMKLVC